MGKIQQHVPVKLLIGVTYRSDCDPERIYAKLENNFSEIELTSEPYDFSAYTDYYEAEMGKNLKKHFLVFKKLIDPVELAVIKITTNLLEMDYLQDNTRLFNLDPGYITQAKLVLATTKNYSHRVYLGQGIFGDVHMHFQGGQYRANPWTYPDYQKASNIELFGKIRTMYLNQLGEKALEF